MISIPVMLLSDPHFHAFKSHSKLVNGVNSRLLDVLSVCNQALDLAIRSRVEIMLIAGDVFHVRGQIRPSIFNLVADWFHSVLLAGIDVVLIPGNHDMESYRGGANSVHSLAYMGGKTRRTNHKRTIAVLDGTKPVVRTRNGLKVLGIPYFHDHKGFRSLFMELSRQHKPDISLIHQGIDDFDFEGVPSTGLTARFLMEENSGFIVSGHYHKPGRLDRVINVGAPLQHRVSDQGQDRGCWVIEPGAGPKFMALDAPRFITIDTTRSLDAGRSVEGNFVHIKATSLEIAQAVRDEALNHGAASVHVLIERAYKTTKSRTVQIATPREMLQTFCGMFDRYKSKQDAILKAFDKLNTREA